MKELKNLELLLKKGHISCRDFIGQVTALGLAAWISPTLLASPVQAATPKKGGRFRIGP